MMPEPVTPKFKLHQGQAKAWRALERVRFVVLACGRRFGKSMLAGYACARLAEQGKKVWWVSPSYPMGSIAWRGLRGLTRDIPGIKILKAERTITFPSGGFIALKSADREDSLRGEGLDLVVLDEAAFIDGDRWTQELRAALSDRGGKALFLSTPKGRNWFWHLAQNAQALPDWAYFHYPTSSNPHIQASEIEAARGLLPDYLFRQEYLAEFIDDGAGVFRGVDASATAPRDEPPGRHRGHSIYFGVDWAQQLDYTVVSGICRDCHQQVVQDRFNKVDYQLQKARLGALVDRWKPKRVYAELNAMGQPLAEDLKRGGMPIEGFTTTNASKAQIIEGLSLAIEKGALQIIPDPVLLSELKMYDMVTLKSGVRQYGAPSGYHDDTVIALALAWHGAGRVSRPVVHELDDE